jgi:hypothetical protein
MGNMKSKNTLTTINKNEKDHKILKLKQQIAINIWIQAFALIAEALTITKLYYLEDPEPGSQEILSGVWIQAIGQLIEAIGVSNQLSAEDTPSLLSGQRTAISGDWLQSIGAAVEAVGGETTLQDAIHNKENGFVP